MGISLLDTSVGLALQQGCLVDAHHNTKDHRTVILYESGRDQIAHHQTQVRQGETQGHCPEEAVLQALPMPQPAR